MADSGVRLRQLQQIPVFALRQTMYDLLADEKAEAALRQRFGQLFNRRVQTVRQVVQRMGREQLTNLVAACPEIDDARIRALFEEYRYGSNPALHVYLFDKTGLDRDAMQGFRQRLEAHLTGFDADHGGALPRVRHLAISDLAALPDRPGVLEGVYRFETRMDYIDATENAACTYQMLYGLFWIKPADGFAIIHARSAEVLKALHRGIEQAVGVPMSPLVISKQLKNALPFLLRDSFRVGRLHDPDPGPGRFRWLTIADENPYAKGYQDLEERYPEVHSVRYRETLDDDRSTTLTIRCDRGALSLTGILRRSQLRAWTLDRLGQLISVLNEFRPNAPAYVATPALEDVKEMAPLNAAQRRHAVQIISALLTAKQSPTVGYQRLGVDALQLAADMGAWMRAQVPIEGADARPEGDGYLACPLCEATTFAIARGADGWEIECRGHRQQRWTTTLPLTGESAGGDTYMVDEDDLAAMLELLPSDALLEIVADVVNRHLPGYTFDLRRESFIVRGPNLVYYPDRSKVRDSELLSAKTVIYVNQQIGHLEGGEVIGVKPDVAEDARN
jgi:hypothetical protein